MLITTTSLVPGRELKLLGLVFSERSFLEHAIEDLERDTTTMGGNVIVGFDVKSEKDGEVSRYVAVGTAGIIN